MGNSGGLTARNPREGFRSEYIAEYIFSGFGTAVQVTQGNDTGIDILCSLTTFEGNLIFVKSSYGVQVKSKGEAFKYSGKQATKWLSTLEFPLLLTEVDKESATVKIYSTWNLNRFLLALHSDKEENFPEDIVFITGEDQAGNLQEPNPKTGEIPVGHPIIELTVSDICKKGLRQKYWSLIDEWLTFDHENYINRRRGIPIAYGYIQWKTNHSFSEAMKIWFKLYYYSNFHDEKVRGVLGNATAAIGVSLRNRFYNHGESSAKEEFNQLHPYIKKYLWKYLPEDVKKDFENPI